MTGTGGPPSSILSRIWQAALVLLAAALTARIVWELLQPLIPMLVIAVVALGLFSLVTRGRPLR